jgi:acyl-CoA synthetase (AMP-forming)/AMP-acid ligase II
MAGSGETISYRELEARSNRAAHLLRKLGLRSGDAVALMLENHPRYLELAWAAQRSGLYLVAVSSRLVPAEAAYIVRDSGAKAFITSPALGDIARAVTPELSEVALFMLDAAEAPFRSWDLESAALPATTIADERAGTDMLYSSGTTGRPKGVRPVLPENPDIAAPATMGQIAQMFGFDAATVYLSPAPLYHAAPLRWSMATHRLGGTVVVMEKFDPAAALAAIARHRITHSQWVPTHFVRMLKMPETERAAHDLSSLRLAIHAAAPCPVPIKQAMIDWWGPILVEYYAGTEGNGMTMIGSAEWLERPGSVGRAIVGTSHICDDDGNELGPREEGTVYFEGGPAFEYHNDPAKTASAANVRGWTTLGDVGWLDEQGFLYLTDRKSFMIISGGVNIYPQEIENLLVTHPRVLDAAVIGAPDLEMGERVVAVIQPIDWADAHQRFAEELSAWLRPQLSGIKMPRRIDFVRELPRHPTGKLYKRLLKDAYSRGLGAAS